MTKKLSNSQIKDLYYWIDDIPLSRPKKNFSRDFSDGGIYNKYNKYLFKCL